MLLFLDICRVNILFSFWLMIEYYFLLKESIESCLMSEHYGLKESMSWSYWATSGSSWFLSCFLALISTVLRSRN